MASSSPHAGSLGPETTGVCIGSGANDASFVCNSEFVTGRIDDVRIYGRALTAAEIAQDMNTAVGSVADTTPPTVSVTAPAAGATVSGSVTVSAGASDNTGVAGVQFKVDGTMWERKTRPPVLDLVEHHDRRQRLARPDGRRA